MERLSSELVIDIISRLPIKYVLRCKSVSKSWEALISDPSFAAVHFNRASPFSNYITSYDRFQHFVEIEDEYNEILSSPSPTPTYKYNINFRFGTDCFKKSTPPILMGSCLGYVCFSAFTPTASPTNPIYLFNPITEANILLPQFKQTLSSTCLYGFGLDVSTQECKVLLVYLYDKTFSVQVHTVGRDYSWRTITVPSMLTDIIAAESMTKSDLQTSLPLGFNGSIHWIVLSSVDKEDKSGPKRACILSFRLDTEVFGVIPMPEPLQVMKPYFYNSMMYALQPCGGCLSIIYSPKPTFVDMWVMDDYNISDSWVKKYSIQLNCMRGFKLMPLGFRKNCELMLHLQCRGLASYNTDSDKYEVLYYFTTISFITFPFAGSLISLKSAYGDSKAVGTSGFGNPVQKQQ